MKTKSLSYRSPPFSLMLAIFLAASSGFLGILFCVTFLLSRFWEGAFGIDNTLSPLFLQLASLSGLTSYLGVRGCVVYGKYRKLEKAVMARSEAVTVQQVSEELACSPSDVLADLGKTLNSRYWSGFGVTDSAFVLVDGAKNAGTILADPDCAFRETTRLSRNSFGFCALVWFLYMINPGLDRWQDFAIAGVVSLVAFLIGAVAFPKKIVVKQQAIRVQEYTPEAVKTGVEEADDLLREGFSRLGHLVDLDKTIGNEKLSKTVRELLDITGQIFEHVRKQPEKARRIRQFVTYYLPTTTKLLRNYEELNRQPVKGGNIEESMRKIEGIMDGILSTFRHHLDDLYRDKNIDISAEIAVMENMISQGGILSGNNR
ncbi:MAG: 5-bromo-4-chloroindolyl phosphate hydrolysis family protein [Betaproteobacteria bacterium]|nr:5-bromo-4-chloroindolyl phosphate hydrolysis family protein [Betaproteobacteria bacterium]